jgi:hypothetical protein
VPVMASSSTQSYYPPAAAYQQSGGLPAGPPTALPPAMLINNPLAGGRPPRSRKNRPCDHCRKSKSRCSIGPAGPPCSQCGETRKACTFDLAPPIRKSRIKVADPVNDDVEVQQADGNVRDSVTPSTPTTTGHRRRRSLSSGSRSPRDPQRPRLDEATLREAEEDSLPRTASSARRDTSLSGLDVLAAAVPSFDHLANSEYDPHGRFLHADRPSLTTVLTVVLTDDLLPISDPRDGGEKSHVKQIVSTRLRYFAST